jgi:DNA ligase D-like protein (predicted 3'-phosphoesterase)
VVENDLSPGMTALRLMTHETSGNHDDSETTMRYYMDEVGMVLITMTPEQSASLDEYRSKRDFSKTREPSGGGITEHPIFVVQEHHASHLHYDFRLSMDGVLKSWAVPKGVPEEKGIKHLAVETEDHPLEYADFEGEIPKGEYGGGKVLIWDRGEYSLEHRDQDKVVVELKGTRLKGRYSIVRFKGRESSPKNWLIMKL